MNLQIWWIIKLGPVTEAPVQLYLTPVSVDHGIRQPGGGESSLGYRGELGVWCMASEVVFLYFHLDIELAAHGNSDSGCPGGAGVVDVPHQSLFSVPHMEDEPDEECRRNVKYFLKSPVHTCRHTGPPWPGDPTSPSPVPLPPGSPLEAPVHCRENTCWDLCCSWPSSEHQCMDTCSQHWTRDSPSTIRRSLSLSCCTKHQTLTPGILPIYG